MKRILLPAILILMTTSLFSQGVKLTPLEHRYQKQSTDNRLNSVLILDTLLLPFFEDFTATAGYPSNLRWTDNQVWVNNNFPENQPNYNVATFDHIDSKGIPYHTLNKNEYVYADSLTSFPIKLDFYKTGPSSTANYLPGDSIILSFFYQRRGFGESPDPDDSLLLFFKDKNMAWNRVWGVSGTGFGNTDFIQVQVKVDQFDYLHNAFQFRFVNYTKATGNMNHWHLDYIRLEKYKNRSGGNDVVDISDVAIVKPGYSMLNNYHSMPYRHFLSNASGLTRSQNQLTVRNLNTSSSKTTQTRFGMKVYNRFNNLVFEQPTSASSRNILFNSDTTVPYPALRLDTFSGINPEYRIDYIIDPQSNDETPLSYNAEGNNNVLSTHHSFAPWYAYDDGTAEGGFGLDYSHLGNIKGQFAMSFDNLLADTLKGFAVYFNRSLEDVAFRSFYLRIWKALSPLGQPDTKDQLIYEQYVNRPMYTDSINHFTYIFFDTALLLPAGTYYIGWRQNQPFILNVGYDNNYRFGGNNVRNPNLYHNLLGSWERVDGEIMGVPMIRPMMGTPAEFSFQVKEVSESKLVLHPNPTVDVLHVSGIQNALSYRIYSLTGLLLESGDCRNQKIKVNNLQQGTYFAVIENRNGAVYRYTFIKQ